MQGIIERAIRDLRTRVAVLEGGGPVDTDRSARILGLSQILPGLSLPAGAWTAIPMTNVVTTFPPRDMRLGTGGELGRLIYTGTEPNALEFHVSIMLDWTGVSNVQISFRKNGDDGTLEPIYAALSMEDIKTGMVGAFDVVTDDYVEFVVNPTEALTATASLAFYCRNAPVGA